VNSYFMEFDTERAGGFEPLRFLLPKNKTVSWAWFTVPKRAPLEIDR